MNANDRVDLVIWSIGRGGMRADMNADSPKGVFKNQLVSDAGQRSSVSERLSRFTGCRLPPGTMGPGGGKYERPKG